MSDPRSTVKRVHKTPIIKGFLKTSFLDWRGRICPVIFLGGCNFRCPYCHNKELVLWPHELPTISFSQVQSCINSYGDWLDGIVISGGEPCLNPELFNLCESLRKMGLQIKLDTNGSLPKVLAQLIHDGLVDYVAMDFKAPLNEFSYRRCTGAWTEVEKIGQSLDLLKNTGVDYEFRVTVCPGLLDINDIRAMGERIKGAKRFVLQNFVPHNTLEPSFADIAPYPKERLEQFQEAISFYVQETLIISQFLD